MNKIKNFLVLIRIIGVITVFQSINAVGSQTNLVDIPVYFIKNDGQFDNNVRYYGKSAELSVFFADSGIYTNLFNGHKGTQIKLYHRNGNKNPEIYGQNESDGKINYFVGRNKINWKSNVSTYGSVVYKKIYEGIDLKFYSRLNQLEYDITIMPGADPSDLILTYENIEGLSLTREGELLVMTKEKDIVLRHRSPFIYQEIGGQKIAREGTFIILNNYSFGFRITSYNKKYPLIIDPVIVFSSYLGGSDLDRSYAVTVDSSGYAYITGETLSSNFQEQKMLPPGYETLGWHVFVSKIDVARGKLVYTTYFGGSDDDAGYDIEVDKTGCVYVTGKTYSNDFTTVNPIQSNNAGGKDAFVTKLSPSGDTILFSTYLGGDDEDCSCGMALDSGGNVCVVGYTYSNNFPTRDPLQENNAGGFDVFITKILSSGKDIIYSSYYGGSLFDHGKDIAFDKYDNMYVTGYTWSSDFPLENPYQSNYGGGLYDAFVMKLTDKGRDVIYATYLGGSSDDLAYSITVNDKGNAFISGATLSTDYPLANPFQPIHPGLFWDAFVTKLNIAGDGLVYSSYLGGSRSDHGFSIALDGQNNAYVFGFTESNDFPTVEALQANHAGGIVDAFISKINAEGSALVYSSYFGGSRIDYGYSIAFYNSLTMSSYAYITGYTSSYDLPVIDAFQTELSGATDAFLSVINMTNLASPLKYRESHSNKLGNIKKQNF
ncbi:MAG: SBBP repeat-containing protein [Chlamydiota bacterium]|nr:SBBP repeat-containing protein [Chlamydiota bacterium]